MIFLVVVGMHLANDHFDFFPSSNLKSMIIYVFDKKRE